MTEWCISWPEELKEAERLRYRAECKVRCLTANLDRIDPSEFDNLMTQIEMAKNNLRCAAIKKFNLLWEYEGSPRGRYVGM